MKIGIDMCNFVCRWSQVLVFKRWREREVASGSRRSRVMVPMKATFGITEAEKSATRNVKSRNVNDVVDFCSFIKLFGCGRLVDVLLMLVYSPDVKRQLPGGQKTAARVTPQRITKSERNSAVLKNIFLVVVVVVVVAVVSVLNTESHLKV